MANFKKPLATALGAAFLASSVVPLASAEVNPFSAQQLSGGYDQANFAGHKEGGCGEGKCGEGKCGEGESKGDHEGSCGEGKGDHEGSCGEGKGGHEGSCGEGKSDEEGKCGEGKCGG